MVSFGPPMELLLLLALAVAVGIDLPLVLLLPVVLSLGAALVPGLGPLPAEWLPLASPAPALLGGILYLGGWTVRRAPGLNWVWEGLLAGAAVPSAFFLVLMFRPAEPALPLAIPGLLAMVVTASLQGGRLGARLLDRILPDRPHAPSSLLRDAGEDLAVLALLTLLLLAPSVAGPSALLGLLAFAWMGRPSLRAARFLPSLTRGIFGHLTRPGSGWLEEGDLPRWVAPRATRTSGGGEGAGPAPPAPTSGLRGTRAALAGPREIGLFRTGWLIWDGGGTLFVYRTLTRSWEVELAPLAPPHTPSRFGRPPPWGKVIGVDPGQGDGVLLLPLDGPENVEDRI
jgi:hypothetical protein